MISRIIFLSFLVFSSTVLAVQKDQVTVSGIIGNINENSFEVKTDKAILVVPKDLVPKLTIQSGKPVLFQVTHEEMDQIKPKAAK